MPEVEPPRAPEASQDASSPDEVSPDESSANTGGAAEPLGSWDAPEPGSTHDSVWTRGPSVDAADASGTGLAGEAVADRTPSLRAEPVLPPATPPAPSRRRVIRRVRRPVALVVGVAAVVVVGALAWSFGLIGGDESADPVVAGESSVPPTPAPATTVVPSTVPVASTTPVTVMPTTVLPTTIAPTTIAPTTTVPPTTIPPTTVAPTTVPAATAVAVGPRVVIAGRIAPCKFGPSCLVADFSIVAFETPQQEFVCEFEDGGRYAFRFDGSGATAACATSAVDGTITIEVGGVRSETVTR